jgi:hypothetical protein
MDLSPLRTQRAHPRVPSDFPVRLQVGNTTLTARARDLSMTGLFLRGPSQLPERLLVSIPLPEEGGEVTTACRVERRERGGVAVSFSDIDWEDLLLLARYVSPRI